MKRFNSKLFLKSQRNKFAIFRIIRCFQNVRASKTWGTFIKNVRNVVSNSNNVSTSPDFRNQNWISTFPIRNIFHKSDQCQILSVYERFKKSPWGVFQMSLMNSPFSKRIEHGKSPLKTLSTFARWPTFFILKFFCWNEKINIDVNPQFVFMSTLLSIFFSTNVKTLQFILCVSRCCQCSTQNYSTIFFSLSTIKHHKSL